LGYGPQFFRVSGVTGVGIVGEEWDNVAHSEGE
jgi:hypothetical protein